MHRECANYNRSLPLSTVRFSKSFKRSPTALEWARFRKNARRMRKLGEYGTLSVLSSEVYSILQLCAINEPLFPNMKSLQLWHVAWKFIPFIPLFLSPKTAVIDIRFSDSHLAKAAIASTIATFPIMCPNLQNISLHPLPRDPAITVVVSGMVLASNRNALRCFRVDSLLTKKAREAIYRLPDLRELLVVIERNTSLPSLVLPSLTDLTITYDYGSDWLRVFTGAALEKVVALTFYSGSEQIDGFLEEFETVALAASPQNELSRFRLHTSRSWKPNYSSLLQFTQLTDLLVEFSCGDVCSSTVDDGVITNLARTMPRLETLRLGGAPCCKIRTGVTAKGLVVLACHCSDLSTLCIHLQVASLSASPEIDGATSNAESTTPWKDCGLTKLEVGKIPAPEGLGLAAALTLVRIFPYIEHISSVGGSWEGVMDAIRLSRNIVDCSSKEHPFSTPRSCLTDTPPGAALENGS